MKILDDIIATLNLDAPVSDIRQGIFHTGVVTRHCGLAATLPHDALKQEPPMVREPGGLLERGTDALVQMAYSDHLMEAAIGMATINSLNEVATEACVERNAAELILERGSGKNVAIVGHFPFIPKIREYARKLWVIEKNMQPGDHSESEGEELIPGAHVLALTGTSLTNHTIDHLLGLCRPDACVIMLGDTVPMSPVLFDYGVDAICGTQVVDVDLALRCLSQGANFRQMRGCRKLTLTK